jgi:signal transduction histidine kinase
LVGEVERLLPDSLHEKLSSVTISREVQPNLMMMSDREKLKQILFNVVRNSVEAVNEGGRIDLNIQKSGPEIIIIVKDDGSGMDEETRARAFTSFFTTKTTGTGLGLAIVDRLTTALEGRIILDSAPGRGTTFTLIFPAAIMGVKNE